MKEEKMSINTQTYQSFRMVPIDENNSHLLKKMVRFQAQHHKCKCVWDTGDKASFERLQSIVEEGTNGTGGFFIFTPDSREPAAYVVHMPIVSSQGSGLYMEDICVHPQCRHGGLGLYAISELAKLAENTGRQYVSWVVAENNESGQRFYSRLNSQQETTTPFFISSSNLYNSNDEYLTYSKELTEKDIPEIRRFCYQNGYDEKFISFENGHKLAASLDEVGRINAISLGSVNTSTFRAVQGLEISEVLFAKELGSQSQARVLAQRDLINRNIHMSQEMGATGHMIWGVDKDDRLLQNDVQNRFGGEILTMTDEPESVLDRHYLDSDQIRGLVNNHERRCRSIELVPTERVVLDNPRLRLASSGR